jgi:hypothetical protein
LQTFYCWLQNVYLSVDALAYKRFKWGLSY